MTEILRSKAQKLADDLKASGHPQHAEEISEVLSHNLVEDALLNALKAVCDTILTAVEAIDPVSEMELERVRKVVDDFLASDTQSGRVTP